MYKSLFANNKIINMNYKNVKQNTTRLIIFILINISALSLKAQSAWTLKDCIDYALENNIQLKQSKLTTLQNKLSVEQSKAALFPALSFSTNQNMSWRPFSQSTINLTNGTMTSTKSTVNYNGSYGLNANMTLWNGGRNTKTIKQNEYAAEMSELDTEQSENSIMEQITQLYVQMLYQKEAVNVCEAILKSSELQRDRAKTMVNVGTLAKVELMQLEAQTTQDQYNLINAKSQLENYRFQLKQLLELPEQNNFDISETQTTDDQIITPIPSKQEVYNVALAQRPEIQSGKLNVESNKLSIKIAKAGYLPSVNLNASVGTNNASGTHTALGEQIKNNLSNSIGLSLSIPIFDQRQNKTNVHKAQLAYQNSQLQLQDTEKKLSSTIENYWLNATTSQQQYIYAKANVESMQASYDLVSEQFRLGLKNIVELTTGKTNLMQAEQQMLQCKYNTLYNLAMLRFYKGETIRL